MSKEQVREMERRLQDALAAIEGLEQPLSLSRLQQVAQEFAEAQQWLKIAALGDVPLEFIQQEDKERAPGELRLLTVRGLCQDGDEPAPNLTKRRFHKDFRARRRVFQQIRQQPSLRNAS
ncbi:hypothetical protein [Burkholderia gladioli]|uniref:hypothetical protein n=1 Tax=Burkholderia gladioli TaxID=28095 RepID=UPI001640A07F|nr:hypothetical protein [Burkholderia gladioli]